MIAEPAWNNALARVWSELPTRFEPAPVQWSGPSGLLPSVFPVEELAMGSVAAAACAADELARARGLNSGPPRVDSRRVAASFRSDQLLRLNGQAYKPFAPLSGFWATHDGWVRTHANYPHHRTRLLTALGLTADPNVDDRVRGQVAAQLARRGAAEIESMITAAGGIAVQVRDRAQWLAHDQGTAVAAAALMPYETRPGGPGPAPTAQAEPGLPMRGFRVLDLTRVIAGPVATRTLALLGADVVRIDSPQLPELEPQHLDMNLGKRSAKLDLDSAADRDQLTELLNQAHVVVTGYRPGALDDYGLGVADLARQRPDLVVATLSAWGERGPYARRRGFDSIVQAASGIALSSAGPNGRPGALPAQALDHATGYLMAAGVMLGLADRIRHQLGTTVRPALANTGHLLQTMSLGRNRPPAQTGVGSAVPPIGDPVAEVEPELTEGECAAGRLRHPRPAWVVADGPDSWARYPGQWGSDPAVWQLAVPGPADR